MQQPQRTCSGLTTGVGCCPKRDNCLRFVHWTQDSRSEFNLCASSDQPFAFFVGEEQRKAAAQALPQQELFA